MMIKDFIMNFLCLSNSIKIGKLFAIFPEVNSKLYDKTNKKKKVIIWQNIVYIFIENLQIYGLPAIIDCLPMMV